MKKISFIIILSLFVSACASDHGTINGRPLTNVGEAAPTLAEPTEPLNILIFGGTSGIGLETTKLALSRGHKVTSITRHPERMSVEHTNLTNLKGDITKQDTFNSSIDGKDAIVSAIGLGSSRKKVTVYSEGMKNVLSAMGKFKVNRVITISGIGAGDSKGHGLDSRIKCNTD